MTEQPKIRAGRTPGSGAPKTASQRRLAQLGFDPMQELVDTYKRLEAEIKWQEDWRDGKIQLLNAKGQPRVFYPDHLYSLYDKKALIADKLLRYGYGRVPETTVLEGGDKPPLVINLRGGGKKVVNGDDG